jgi:ribosomal protein S18 acetylase RimI-like enzyme
VYSIITHPDYRGLGIATQLLTALEAEARNHGYARMQLEVQTSNTAAIRFYEKHGYTACGLKPGYYDNGSDALKMGKTLQP